MFAVRVRIEIDLDILGVVAGDRTSDGRGDHSEDDWVLHGWHCLVLAVEGPEAGV